MPPPGNYKGASAKVEAAAALAKSPEENKLVSQMKDYIASKSGDPSTPIGAKAKFAQDYNAGKLKDVITDGDILRQDQLAGRQFSSGDRPGLLSAAQFQGLHQLHQEDHGLRRRRRGAADPAALRL